jgi:hypothetical protein
LKKCKVLAQRRDPLLRFRLIVQHAMLIKSFHDFVQFTRIQRLQENSDMYMKLIVRAISVTVAAILMTSCGAKNVSEPAGDIASASPEQSQSADKTVSSGSEEGISLYPAALDMPKGKSIALAAEIGGGQTAQWTSSEPSVASVSQDGTVSALSAGEAMISVSSGSFSDVCRVTVTEKKTTLAYPEDPAPTNHDKQESSDNSEDNLTVIIPDDQNKVDKAFFVESEYTWQFIIDDGFDTKLQIPMSGISYMVNCHIALDAHKVGGKTLLGDYEGTMEMKMAIDEASFLSAMQSQGIPATDMNSAINVQTVDISFSLVPYDLDKANSAKYAFAPSGTIPVVSLVQIPAMAISSAKTSTSGNLEIVIDEGYGSAALTDQAGKIPIVIEAGSGGEATLYLPRMLSMCEHDSFHGTLAKMPLLNIK